MKLATVIAIALTATPRLAEACPTCSVGQAGGGSRFALVATMLCLPFVLALLLWPVFRRLLHREDEP